MTQPKSLAERSAALVAELRESGGQFSDGEAILYDPVVDERNKRAASRIEELERERDRFKQERDWQYDENVNRIAAEGAALLRAETAESKAARLEEENGRLREALEKLVNEVSGNLGAFESDFRPAIGNTNFNVLTLRLDEARAALRKETT